MCVRSKLLRFTIALALSMACLPDDDIRDGDYRPEVDVVFPSAESGSDPPRVPNDPAGAFDVEVSACGGPDLQLLLANLTRDGLVGEPDAGGGRTTIRLRPSGEPVTRCGGTRRFVGRTTMANARVGLNALLVETAGVQTLVEFVMTEPPDPDPMP